MLVLSSDILLHTLCVSYLPFIIEVLVWDVW